MRVRFKRFLLAVLGGCLLWVPTAFAQQTNSQPYYNGSATQEASVQTQNGYIPYAPQAIYTNTGQQAVDPMALAESAYAMPAYASMYTNGGEGAVFAANDEQYAYGYQPSYAYNKCQPSYQPGLTCGKWFITGWLDQGFTYNMDKPHNKQNGPLRYNDRANEYQINQLYVAAGRAVATSGCCWDFGIRADFLYGSDYYYTSAIGLETRTTTSNGLYQQDQTGLPSRWNSNNGPRSNDASRFGLSMPQLYAEMYVPLHYGLSVKAGHFYSIMGYESVMSPQNFFYSHSYSMMFGQPVTHTGILFSQRLTSRLTGIFGVTRGWDTWEDPNGKMSYLAGFRWNSWDGRTEFSWIGESGNETVSDSDNPNATSRTDAIRSHYSMVLSHQLTPRLKLVTQHDLGYENDATFERYNNGASRRSVNGHWYSLSQYAFYQWSDTLSFGIRGEWFRDVNSTRIHPAYPVRSYDNTGALTRYIDGQDYSQVTVGLNWKPYECLVIRPEARWDWSGVGMVDNSGIFSHNGMYDDFNKKKQTTISLSAYITY